jgi:hypothetical protein
MADIQTFISSVDTNNRSSRDQGSKTSTERDHEKSQSSGLVPNAKLETWFPPCEGWSYLFVSLVG